MAINIDPNGTYFFPSELDTITFSGLTEDAPVSVNWEGGGFTTILTPGVDGKACLEDFGSLLRDIATDNHAHAVTIVCAQESFTEMVLPCRVELGLDAVSFARQHFLTLCGGRKTTIAGAQEFLTFFDDREQRDRLTVQQVWWDPIRCILKRVTLEEGVDYGDNRLEIREWAPGYVQAELSPFLFRGPDPNDVLIQMTAEAGVRTMEYKVHMERDCEAVSLVFRNAFGQWDSFHFLGTTSTAVKPTRNSANVAGRTINYLVKSIPEYTSLTDGFFPEEDELLEDLCASTEVFRDTVDGAKVTIIDNDCSTSNDRYKSEPVKVTWRYASNARHSDLQSVGTFDETFDKTFC